MRSASVAKCVLIAVLCPATGWCSDFFMAAHSGALVDHPVGIHPSGRSLHAWNDGVGRWGESVGEQFLKLEGKRQGFSEVLEVKNASNNGIDRILLKRGPDGVIKDFRFVEIKAHRSFRPKLSNTKLGMQMSKEHIDNVVRQMRKSSSSEVQGLARELRRVRKAVGKNWDDFREVVHINTRTGRLVRYKYANGQLVVHRNYSLQNLFRIIQKSPSKELRKWATRHLAIWDQIRATRMSAWLPKQTAKASTRAIAVASKQGTQRALAEASKRASATASKQILAKAARYAGPVAMAIAVAFEAKEFVDIAIAYRSGSISGRELGRRSLTAAGGIAGAYVGASYGLGAGAATGAWVGAFGGPFAWATVPAGTVIGGLVGSVAGGVAGGLAGGTAASYGANALLGSIDTEIREKFEDSFLAAAFPR
jgi:hypothetical protein